MITTTQAADAAPPVSAGAPVAVEQSAATVVPLDRRPVAICGCCGSPYSLAAWQCLPLAEGNGGRGDGPLDGTELELRACRCGSHIGAVLRGGVYLLHAEYVRLTREAA